MISEITRVEITALAAGSAGGITAITGNEPMTVGIVVAIVTATVTVMTWLDKRIDKKFKASMDTYHRDNVAQHRRIEGQINHLRELLAVTGAVPNLTPEPLPLDPEEAP